MKMSMNTGRIKLPRGRTANERAKDAAERIKVMSGGCRAVESTADESETMEVEL